MIVGEKGGDKDSKGTGYMALAYVKCNPNHGLSTVHVMISYFAWLQQYVKTEFV